MDEIKTILQTMIAVLGKRNTCHSACMFVPVNQNNELILAQVKEFDVDKMLEQAFGQRTVNTRL